MSVSDLRATVLDCLAAVAPEADLAGLDPNRAFHDQIDIDSIDYVNFVLRLEKSLGLRIGELDYPKLSTLDGCLDYVSSRLGDAAGSATGH
jgi:acyl carrier protein